MFKQNYTQKLFIAFNLPYSCCFGSEENLDFPDFLQKKFYNIKYRSLFVNSATWVDDIAKFKDSITTLPILNRTYSKITY